MSNFPDSFDNDTTLYLVHDGLRLRLAEDYTPGDTSIAVDGDAAIMAKFPSTGLLTLTDQCSATDRRALSFSYTGKTDTTFTGLILLDGFIDVAKSKRVTNVVQNIMAEHHNDLKDAIIAIETFVGVKDDTSLVPLKGSLEARSNFLRKLVLEPRSWFNVNRRVGVVPLCVEFNDLSTRDPTLWTWDFGDGTISVISKTTIDITGSISKCYYTPGAYDVTLTVENEFGSNTFTINDYVVAHVEAPDAATISFLPLANQLYNDGIIRSRINNLINILVDTNGEQSLDPIISYTWELGDDLNHEKGSSTVAAYSIGGIYDVRLRTDTLLGAFRYTKFPEVIDIVEDTNLWHFIFDPSSSSGTTKVLYTYELGLFSETYKTSNLGDTLTVTRDASFLTGADDESRQTNEFLRNNGFAARTTVTSGNQGAILVYWAEGAASAVDSQNIQFREYNGFNQVWITPALSSLTRRWNWIGLNAGNTLYFALGSTNSSATNQVFTSVNLTNLSTSDISTPTYSNGAEILQSNVGSSEFSVYRSVWRDTAGFWLRNDDNGAFFRLKNFYGTDGTTSEPLQTIRKLTDIPGSTKYEGQLVAMSAGLYFFNNSGEVAVYNPTTNVWMTGGPGVSSPIFTALQDITVPGYDSATNTLLAASDGNHRTYLCYDYSTRAMIRYNEVDATFTAITARPAGEQFLAAIY